MGNRQGRPTTHTNKPCTHIGDYDHRLHPGPTGGHWRDNCAPFEHNVSHIRRVHELFDAYG